MGDTNSERVTDPHHADWYWDLDKRTAVRADERGPADHTLGPYPTRAEAENWKSTADRRNDSWDADDEAWKNDDPHS